MRIGLPERVSPGKTVIFAVVGLMVQQIQHTDILFSALYFAFVILSMLAFNTAGGFTRIAGSYVACFSLLVCIFGVTWKMVLGEAGETNLSAPELTMTCYVVSMGMFLVVANFLKGADFRSYEFGAGGRSQGLNYTAAGLGCLVISIAINVADLLFGISPGGILSALRQLDAFLPLGIMLSTIGAINDSHGKRTMNFVNAIGMTLMFSVGLSGFSKQGMLTPLVCWLIAVVYKKFDLRRTQIIAIAFGAFMSFYVFSPLSQARDLKPDGLNFAEQLLFGIDSIIHIQTVREHIKEQGDTPPAHSYYNTAQNALIGRLNMIGTDDALINFASGVEPLGMETVWNGFLNFIPHALAPNKKLPLSGNYYAHEVGGLLAPDDFGTGISFSPVAESFRIEHWIGLLAVLPAVWFLMFTTAEFICGDLKTSPWSLLPMLLYAHAAPEGLLAGQIYLIGFGNASLMLGILVCTRLAPALGRLFAGSQQNVVAVPTVRPVMPAGASPASAL